MKFLLDENVEFRIAGFLTQEGHDVKTIAEDYIPGMSDLAVLDRARHEGRILITNDRDFGELIFHQGLTHAGVIYFRLPLDATASEKMGWLRRIFAEHRADLDAFLVITPQAGRVRR